MSRAAAARLASTDIKDHIEEVAEHCGDLEALFLAPGTVLSAEQLGSLRSQWKHSVCLALGCEVSEAAYDSLRQQYERHDEELAGAREIPEGLPPEGERGGCGCKHASNQYHACTVRRQRIERATFSTPLPTPCRFG